MASDIVFCRISAYMSDSREMRKLLRGSYFGDQF